MTSSPRHWERSIFVCVLFSHNQTQQASSTRMGVEPESRGSPCVKARTGAQDCQRRCLAYHTLMHELAVQMARKLHRARKRHKRALGISWNPLLVQLACRHWADPRRSQKANDRNIQNDLSYCWFWFCRTECCSQQIMHARNTMFSFSAMWSGTSSTKYIIIITIII